MYDCADSPIVIDDSVIFFASTPAGTLSNFAVRLEKAVPDADGELASSIRQLREMLDEKKSQLGAQVPAAELLGESAELESRVTSVLGGKAQAKSQMQEDTRDLDRIDGELYLMIGDIYDAGRRSIRAGRIDAPIREFSFQYCQYHRSAPANSPAPAPEN